jgi:hypothetical protein
MRNATADQATFPEPKERHTGLLRLLKDAVIVAAISLCLVLVGEIILRTFFPQRLIGTSLQGRRLSVADPVIGMRYVPGAHWRFTHPEYTVEYAINGDGFRDAKKHPVPKPIGATRVLLLGDSFTFGQGVNYEDTWPVIVERLLEESGNRHIDLVKAGIQGMDTRSQFILLQELSQKYDPDVVVVGFLINDLYSNSLHWVEPENATLGPDTDNGVKEDSVESWLRTMKHTFVRNDRYGEFHLLNLLRRTLLANDLLYCKLYMTSARGEFMSEPWTSEVAQKVKITEILFNKMQEYALAKGKKLIVFSLPQQFQVMYRREYQGSQEVDVTVFDRYFSAVAKQSGFVWVSSLEYFVKAKKSPADLFYRWDGHFAPAGNQTAANVFMQKIVPLVISPTKRG